MTDMTQAPTPGPLSEESAGPYSCIRCDNSTWNDDDICDQCAAEACAPENAIDWPDADGWMSWDGAGTCPVQLEQMVEYRTRSGDTYTDPAGALFWPHTLEGHDIIAFRLAPTAPVEASGSERLWPVGSWLSAALDDPKVCEAMKADIREWFDNGGHLHPQPSGETREQVARLEERLNARQMKAKEEAWNLVPQGQRAKWIEDSLSSATVEVSYTDLLALTHPAPVASGGQHSSGEGKVLAGPMVYIPSVDETPARAEAQDEGSARERVDVRSLVAHVLTFEAYRTMGISGLPFPWAIEGADAYWQTRLDMADKYLALRPDIPVPTQDDDKLRIEKASVIRDRLRQIWEGDTHLVYSGNPPEPSHDEEGPLALLANEAVEALNSIFPVPDDFAALKSTAAKEGGEL